MIDEGIDRADGKRAIRLTRPGSSSLRRATSLGSKLGLSVAPGDQLRRRCCKRLFPALNRRVYVGRTLLSTTVTVISFWRWVLINGCRTGCAGLAATLEND